MSSLNKVHLDGMVEACRMVGAAGGRSVAKLTVLTLHPRENLDAPPSEAFEKAHHVVRVLAPEGDALGRELESLSKELRVERASGSPDLAVPHPCSLDGVLRTVDGETFIDVDGKDFRFTEKVGLSAGNNVAVLEGRVKSVSYTDGSARVNVSAKEGDVSVLFARDANPEGWNLISSGRLRSGDRVSLSGPLFDRVFTDGHRRQREYFLTPQRLEKLVLEKKRAAGVSM